MSYRLNNFTGSLTRRRIGSINSGSSVIGKTHSIDPFSDPGVLMFNETPTNLDPSHATVTDLIVDGVNVEESGTLYEYCIDRSGTVYKINTSTDAITVITNSLGITLKYGGGIKYILPNGASKLFIAHDAGALYMNTNGTSVVNLQNLTSITTHDTDYTTSNSTIAIDQTILATMYIGQPIQLSGGSVPPPTPLVYGTTYYVIPYDPTHIQLATSAANALAGTNITITDTGLSGGTFIYQLTNWRTNIPHPISDEFYGGIFIGNGPLLTDFSINSLSISHVSRLNPTFPLNYTINSLEVDGEGRYMRINGTTGIAADIIAEDSVIPTQAVTSRAVYWNGIDASYDSYDPFSQSVASSMFSFLGVDIMFAQDFWGSGIFESSGGNVDKILAMQSVKTPTSNAITSTGTLLIFGAPYYVQGAWLGGIFAFGKLDDTDENALYPLLGITPSDSNTVCTQVGMVRLVQNRLLAESGNTLKTSKFYVSTYETGSTPHANLYSFSLTPGNGTPVNGAVYETQIEQSTVPEQVDRVAFSLSPTQSGVHFKLELIDVDGTVPTSGSIEYTYQAGTDETQLQGAISFFDWAPPNTKNFTGLGLRITNLGTVQPKIQQVYVQTHLADKGEIDIQ